MSRARLVLSGAGGVHAVGQPLPTHRGSVGAQGARFVSAGCHCGERPVGRFRGAVAVQSPAGDGRIGAQPTHVDRADAHRADPTASRGRCSDDAGSDSPTAPSWNSPGPSGPSPGRRRVGCAAAGRGDQGGNGDNQPQTPGRLHVFPRPCRTNPLGDRSPSAGSPTRVPVRDGRILTGHSPRRLRSETSLRRR